MNRHQKLGIIIAPFLAIGGYIAADYYARHKEEKQRYHRIDVVEECDIGRNNCELQGGGLSLKLSNQNGTTQVLSNFPLKTAAIALSNETKESPHNLEVSEDQKLWSLNTAAFAPNAKPGSGYSLRLVVTANAHVFFSEFDTITLISP